MIFKEEVLFKCRMSLRTPVVKGLVPRMVLSVGGTAFKRWSLAGRC